MKSKNKKKIVLYNPTIDYSAPLLQQTNPELMGSHPHAHQQQQQPPLNQVRQQQRTSTTFTPIMVGSLQQHQQLSNGAAATTATTTTTTTLPLQLSDLSNLNLNNSNNSNFIVNELNAMQKLGQQQVVGGGGLLQGIGVVGMGAGDSNGLLTSSSSISSNLLISNSNPTTAAATSSSGAANKMDTPWSQAAVAATFNINNGNSSNNSSKLQQFNNGGNTTDAISSLWSCNSSNSSSGCSSADSASSQPSLSPISTTSTTRPNYRSNSKESLWSSSQTSPVNNFKETFFNSTPNCNSKANDVGAGGGGVIKTIASPTSSQSSSCSPSSPTSSSLSAFDFVGKNIAVNAINLWGCNDNTSKNNNNGGYFAASTDDTQPHFTKISNIWDIPNPAAKDAVLRSNDLFNDLWSSNTATNMTSCSASQSNAFSGMNSGSSVSAAAELDANNIGDIWRRNSSNTAVAAGGRALLKQQQQLAAAAAANKPPLVRPLGVGTNGGGGGGPNLYTGGSAEVPAGSAACMQLFSEEFLNYLNMIN